MHNVLENFFKSAFFFRYEEDEEKEEQLLQFAQAFTQLGEEKMRRRRRKQSVLTNIGRKISGRTGTATAVAVAEAAAAFNGRHCNMSFQSLLLMLQTGRSRRKYSTNK